MRHQIGAEAPALSAGLISIFSLGKVICQGDRKKKYKISNDKIRLQGREEREGRIKVKTKQAASKTREGVMNVRLVLNPRPLNLAGKQLP